MNINNSIEKLKKLNVITPLAFAGHGKDYIVELLSKLTNRKTETLSFSDGMKKIIAAAANKEFILNIKKQLNDNEIERFDTKNQDGIFELFEYLKNEKPNVTVFMDLNMRDFMIFIMGHSYLLDIDPNFKVKLACLDAIEKLKKNDNLLFVANSTRYEDELLFTFALNQSKDPIEFFQNYISSINIPNFSEKNIQKNLDVRLNYQLKNYETEFLYQIFLLLEEKNSAFLKYENNAINKDEFLSFIKKQKAKYLSSTNYEKVFEYGVIHIYRPLLPRVHRKIDDIDKAIIDYTHITTEELDLIKQQYAYYNIEFNQSNIEQLGFLRSNPFNESETTLNRYKPIAILNHYNIDTESLRQQFKKIEKNKIKLKI